MWNSSNYWSQSGLSLVSWWNLNKSGLWTSLHHSQRRLKAVEAQGASWSSVCFVVFCFEDCISFTRVIFKLVYIIKTVPDWVNLTQKKLIQGEIWDWNRHKNGLFIWSITLQMMSFCQMSKYDLNMFLADSPKCFTWYFLYDFLCCIVFS